MSPTPYKHSKLPKYQKNVQKKESTTNILDGLKKELRREDLKKYSDNLIKMMHSRRDKFLDSGTPIRSYKYREPNNNDFPDLEFGNSPSIKSNVPKHFEAQQSVIIEQNSININDKTDQIILR